jgi:hypothetical protein
MELEGSLQHSQEISSCPYLELDQSSLTPIPFIQNPSQYYTLTYVLVFLVVFFPLAFPPVTISEETAMTTKVYKKKLTHTGRYPIFKSNDSPLAKRSLIQIIHKNASTICQEQDRSNEVNCLGRDLQLSGYPQGFIDSVTNSKDSSCPNKDEMALGSLYFPYAKAASETFKCICSLYKVMTMFRTEHSLRSSLMKTRPERLSAPSASHMRRLFQRLSNAYVVYIRL